MALGHVRQLLKPGGQAILTVPALQSLWSVHDVINLHYRRYDKRGFKRLIEDSGFTVRDLRYFFLWPLGLMYLRKLLLGTKQRPGKSYTVTVPFPPVNRLFVGLSHSSRGSCASASAGRLAVHCSLSSKGLANWHWTLVSRLWGRSGMLLRTSLNRCPRAKRVMRPFTYILQV